MPGRQPSPIIRSRCGELATVARPALHLQPVHAAIAASARSASTASASPVVIREALKVSAIAPALKVQHEVAIVEDDVGAGSRGWASGLLLPRGQGSAAPYGWQGRSPRAGSPRRPARDPCAIAPRPAQAIHGTAEGELAREAPPRSSRAAPGRALHLAVDGIDGRTRPRAFGQDGVTGHDPVRSSSVSPGAARRSVGEGCRLPDPAPRCAAHQHQRPPSGSLRGPIRPWLRARAGIARRSRCDAASAGRGAERRYRSSPARQTRSRERRGLALTRDAGRPVGARWPPPAAPVE